MEKFSAVENNSVNFYIRNLLFYLIQYQINIMYDQYFNTIKLIIYSNQ
jgi:hypothetical protein